MCSVNGSYIIIVATVLTTVGNMGVVREIVVIWLQVLVISPCCESIMV